MKWSHIKNVAPTDLDINNIASASAYLRYMQEAAHHHMVDFPPSPDDLLMENKVFILSRTSLSVHRPLRACEKAVVSTWACEGHGASFPRCAEVSVNGELCAEMSSVWALVDISDKSLCRTDAYPQSYSSEAPNEPALPLRLRFPRDTQFENIGKYTVRYSDVDINRHLNNTKYPDIFCSFLPSMEGIRVKDMVINYASEAPIGAVINILTAKTENGIAFRSVLPNGVVNAEALFVFEKI